MVVSYRSFGKMYRFHLRMSGPGIFFLDCLTLEVGRDRLSGNVRMELPSYVA